MGKMTLDMLLTEILRGHNGQSYSVPLEELQDATIELIEDIFEVGEKILSELSNEKMAAIFSLVQTSVMTAALRENNLKVVVLSNTEEFQDAVIWAVQATAGLLTMEEIR